MPSLALSVVFPPPDEASHERQADGDEQRERQGHKRPYLGLRPSKVEGGDVGQGGQGEGHQGRGRQPPSPAMGQRTSGEGQQQDRGKPEPGLGERSRQEVKVDPPDVRIEARRAQRPHQAKERVDAQEEGCRASGQSRQRSHPRAPTPQEAAPVGRRSLRDGRGSHSHSCAVPIPAGAPGQAAYHCRGPQREVESLPAWHPRARLPFAIALPVLTLVVEAGGGRILLRHGRAQSLEPLHRALKISQEEVGQIEAEAVAHHDAQHDVSSNPGGSE